MPGGTASVIRLAWDALLDLVYPPHCVACGRMGAWLCAPCLATYPAFRPPLCPRCGRPRVREGLCPRCRADLRAGGGVEASLSGVRSVGLHVSPLREAVQALKYEGVRVLAEPLADVLGEVWKRAPLPVTAVVPVPLHPRRVRLRGYNQAVLLARAFAPRVGLALHEDWVARSRDTRSQVGLSRDERWANVSGAFRCSGDVAGHAVLLLDDVLTTGATLRACADALRMAGAVGVWALTLTRARMTLVHGAGTSIATTGDPATVPAQPVAGSTKEDV